MNSRSEKSIKLSLECEAHHCIFVPVHSQVKIITGGTVDENTFLSRRDGSQKAFLYAPVIILFKT
ncbi:MAG: hypothetical protein ABI840_08715 [bacterium]